MLGVLPSFLNKTSRVNPCLRSQNDIDGMPWPRECLHSNSTSALWVAFSWPECKPFELRIPGLQKHLFPLDFHYFNDNHNLRVCTRGYFRKTNLFVFWPKDIIITSSKGQTLMENARITQNSKSMQSSAKICFVLPMS